MRSLLLWLAIVSLIFAEGAVSAQQKETRSSYPSASAPQSTPTPASQETPPASLKTLEDTITASEDDGPPSRKFIRWNEYQGPYFTLQFGAGLLYDYGAFAQDQNSKSQITMFPGHKVRDFRVLFRGKLFPGIKRSITWSAGVMYDAPNSAWRMRQTGIMIATPELWGSFFVGRTKEGFSMNKIMVGYDGLTMERSTMNDATIPILADGIKWLGYLPKRKILWNLGYYNDVLSQGQSFSTYSSQVSGRFVVLPILSEKENKVLHLGVMARVGKPLDNKIRFRSRPESNVAPYFLDTGSFESTSTRMAGYEAYYRGKRWFFGNEYWRVFVSSDTKSNPTFHGGDFIMSYLFNDATRPYNTAGGYFRALDPKRSVFEGGPGAWELVFRYTRSDFNDKTVQGGTFARFTSQVNWYLSQNLRLELNYGYGRLNRFDLKGNTQFLQSRFQFYF
ncbi:MAG TPA: porin [Pyrinomonadaceae bacterium]|nr:porin [Pyrinomonadaceae bacterium]